MKESMDHIWEEIHSSRSWGVYPTEHVIRFVARNFYQEERNHIKILDFGCGQGAHTWYLAREGFDTYAFDGSSSAVQKVEKKLKSEGLSCHVSVQDGRNIDYPADFFDAIIDNVCIYANLLDDIKAMYLNTYKILKPGGKLLTVSFGEDLDGYKSGEEVEPGTYRNIKSGILVDRGLSHIFTQSELIEVLKATGFRKVECEWIKYTDKGNLVHQYVCKAEK